MRLIIMVLLLLLLVMRFWGLTCISAAGGAPLQKQVGLHCRTCCCTVLQDAINPALLCRNSPMPWHGRAAGASPSCDRHIAGAEAQHTASIAAPAAAACLTIFTLRWHSHQAAGGTCCSTGTTDQAPQGQLLVAAPHSHRQRGAVRGADGT